MGILFRIGIVIAAFDFKNKIDQNWGLWLLNQSFDGDWKVESCFKGNSNIYKLGSGVQIVLKPLTFLATVQLILF